MDITLWLLPVVGAIIGWLTNEVAVRMLFHPKQPLRVPGTSITFQGVLPRRHGDLAASIGQTVADDLLPKAELLAHLDVDSFQTDLVRAVGDHVAERLHGRRLRLLPDNVAHMLVTYVREIVEREAGILIKNLLQQLGGKVVSRIDVQAIVEQKMLQLDLDELERMARRIAGKELQAIVIFGAVLGFLIGLLQMVLVAGLLRLKGAGG